MIRLSQILLGIIFAQHRRMTKDTTLNAIFYLILGIVSGFSTFCSGTLFGIAREQMSMRLRIEVFTTNFVLHQEMSSQPLIYEF